MKHIKKRTLIVDDSLQGDVYKDIARIHWKERGAKRNRIGSIVAIRVDNGPRHFFSLRGLDNKDLGKIRFDFVARQALKLEIGTTHDFTIQEANPLQKLKWALHATDPVARIATWIALWSLILGLAGLALAAWPIIEKWIPSHKSADSAVHSSGPIMRQQEGRDQSLLSKLSCAAT